MRALECIVPLLPPVHAAEMDRALRVLRAHLFAAQHSGRQGEGHGDHGNCIILFLVVGL
jgi:hypothetical protein